ncbi:hypothetical protein [Treponema denticola]|uniref:hypothetical protein n=1 Tax=Treponema denticola TaxID=158 RepID=UPI0020A5F6C8|nr:hypothetical protein [Treponema denticola]UTC83813.1 hypothetical protein HGJ18_11655 [Treponema denticola]
MLEESFIYNYVKERYEYEQERKNQLNNMISIPLGLISVLFGFLAYFFGNLPPSNSARILLLIFYFFLVLSILALINCIIFFVRHQIGYDYAYIADPNDIDNYKKRLIEYYKTQGKTNICELVTGELRETLYNFYLDGSQINIKNNEKKIKMYRSLIISIIINIILFSITFCFRFFLPETISPAVKINSDRPIVFSVDGKIPIHINDPLTIENDIHILLKETANIKITNPVTIKNDEDNSITNNLKEEENE